MINISYKGNNLHPDKENMFLFFFTFTCHNGKVLQPDKTNIFLFTCTNVESSIGVFQLKEAQNSAWNFVVGKKLATWSLEFEKACFDVLKNSVIILLIIQIRILKG